MFDDNEVEVVGMICMTVLGVLFLFNIASCHQQNREATLECLKQRPTAAPVDCRSAVAQ